ncbi:EamA-like transporter family protein [Bordetella bronchiseptica MBORD707]|nr:DMT family transporter [Bordetella bronchiseptica]KDD11378.1 EamA-like transporter family protein [Bordetella bronchiseptica MBORD707]
MLPAMSDSSSPPLAPGRPARGGHACLALAMVLAGSTVPASKLIAAEVAPFTATAIRLALALPVFLLLMRATGARWPRPGRRDACLLALQAAAGSVGYTALLIAGLRLTSAADAAVVIGTLPAVTALLAMAVLRERPPPRTLAAIALAAAGVLVLVGGRTGGAPGSLAGNLLVLGAVVCEGLFILLSKRLRTPIAPLPLSAALTAIGAVLAGAAALAEAPWHAAFGGPALAVLAYYAWLPTVAGFVLWYAGLARASASEAALFTALAPVAAVLLAALALGETVGPRQAAGIGCVLAAVLALRPGGDKQSQKENIK